MKYLETYSNDPEYNLAFEEYCFRHLPLENDEYFFLWQNGPAVIIGKNQNAYQEVNDDYVSKHNLKVVRRITGGGAAMQSSATGIVPNGSIYKFESAVGNTSLDSWLELR